MSNHTPQRWSNPITILVPSFLKNIFAYPDYFISGLYVYYSCHLDNKLIWFIEGILDLSHLSTSNAHISDLIDRSRPAPFGNVSNHTPQRWSNPITILVPSFVKNIFAYPDYFISGFYIYYRHHSLQKTYSYSRWLLDLKHLNTTRSTKTSFVDWSNFLLFSNQLPFSTFLSS